MFSTAPGAGEAQRAATWHMRGASSGWAAGDWAAADLRAFSVQLTGFRLTLCCQEAHLLGRLWPGHDHSPSGPWQLSLMHTWSAGGTQSLGAKALSSHLRPPAAHTGQGWVQPGQDSGAAQPPSPSQGLPRHQLQPPPGGQRHPGPQAPSTAAGLAAPKKAPQSRKKGSFGTPRIEDLQSRIR